MIVYTTNNTTGVMLEFPLRLIQFRYITWLIWRSYYWSESSEQLTILNILTPFINIDLGQFSKTISFKKFKIALTLYGLRIG